MLIEGTALVGREQEEVKSRFLEQQRWVNEKLAEMQRDDPVLADPEPESEFGTESWKATTHAEMEVEKQGLLRLREHTREAISLVEKGLFGKCKLCGSNVEEVRLQSPVTATKCASCANSASSPMQYRRAA